MSRPLDPRWGQPDPTHDPYILAGFRARPGDVLITTAPKAGTTWMQQILHQLRSGGDPDFPAIDEVVPWLELPREGRSTGEVLAGYEALPEPRIFKTHCTFEQTPGSDTARIILSSRDPRDCCTSFCHHVLDMTDEARRRSGFDHLRSFDDVFEAWLGGGAWYRNVEGWWPHRDAANLLWLRYEDMKRDLPGSIDRIAAFLGWSLTAAQRNDVIRYSSFDWMKAHSGKFIGRLPSGQPAFRPGGFIRKGEVGDHRAHLNSGQERRILDQAQERLEPECLRFLGI